MKRTKAFYCLIYLVCALFFSCGLDSFVYLAPVEIVSATDVTRAEIVLPDQPTSAYDSFRNYTIFYRIYLSYFPVLANVESQLGDINTTLRSDYERLDPFTIDDNVSPASIDSVFRNLKYYSISLRDNLGTERQLYEVLNSRYWGTIRLDFSSRERAPFLTNTNGIEYDLFRAYNFTSLPNRYFYYTDNSSNSLATSPISDTINTDLQARSGTGPTPCAYVSMYILATGIDDNYAPLYSRPKHIGVFRLPD